MKKEFILPDSQTVVVRKSTRAKRMILRLNHDNEVVVTVPKLVPYLVGFQFAKSKQQWIQEHRQSHQASLLKNNDRIGRDHRLVFKSGSTTAAKSHVRNKLITVTHPTTIGCDHLSVQQEAIKAATRAIKKEADAILPQILHTLAQKYDYRYSSVQIKNMRTRWGSCSSEKSINLSIWLIQLPEELIEYVCCHELTHLNHQHHQAAFWEELSTMIPDWKNRRKQLKEYRPSLIARSL